jgi:Protein of unknown function (DUF3160)
MFARSLLMASLVLLSCRHGGPSGQWAERTRIPPQAQALADRPLAAQESAVLGQDGFVLSRDPVQSFHVGYTALFHAHQPVYVTADSVLYAWHASYDTLLMELEVDALIPELTKLLAALRTELATKPVGEARDDLDLYLSVAQGLLTGAKPEPAAAELIAQCEAASGAGTLTLFGAPQNFDFSMLAPRGHYNQSYALQHYFRAMSFLGRVELRLAKKKPDGKSWEINRRTLRAAALLDSVFSESTRTTWRNLDTTLESFVGPPDSMSLPGLSRGISALGDVEKSSDAAVVKAFEGLGAQERIRTQLVLPGEGAISFVLLGQRFVYDTKVLSELVYGALDTQPMRMMPSPLDVAATVFNNPAARELLEPEVQKYGAPYAAALEREGKQTELEPATLWTGSLYHGWLRALGALSPDATRDVALPAPLNSKAWSRRMLNTQLASWAELRHDNLLYAKQSVTMMLSCEFPFGYVDPYPAFFEAMEHLAVKTTTTIDALPYQTPGKAKLLTWLTSQRATMVRLRDIAVRERANQPLRDEDLDFFNHMVSLTGRSAGCTTVTEPEGWYADLFLDRSKALWQQPVVADVHTQPTDEEGNMVGFVLHVGTRAPRMMTITLQHDGGAHAQTYRGFVSTWAQQQTSNFERLTDETWAQQKVESPDWLRLPAE